MTTRAIHLTLQIVRHKRHRVGFAARVRWTKREPDFLVRDGFHFPTRRVVTRHAVDVRVRGVVTGNWLVRLERVRVALGIGAVRFVRVRVVAVGATFAGVRACTQIDFVRVAMAFFAQLGAGFHRLVRIGVRVKQRDRRVEPRDLFRHVLLFGFVALITADVLPVRLGDWLGRGNLELARRARCGHLVQRRGHPVHRRMTARAIVVVAVFADVGIRVLTALPRLLYLNRLTSNNGRRSRR